MRWNYIHIDTSETMNMSGWKLYIYGDSEDQASELTHLLRSVVSHYNLTTKVATKSIIDRNINTSSIAWSVMVIYLTGAAVKNINELIECINNKLHSYHYSGHISGAYSINGKIHCRYDVSSIVDPIIGINYDEYISLYRGEYGEYNIPGNPHLLKY
jgi:hypothetical protein